MILTAGDYENILKDGLIQKLNWLEEEFSFLFNSKKGNYSQNDRALAHQIIKDITESINCSEDAKIKELFIDTLKSINNIYPELF